MPETFIRDSDRDSLVGHVNSEIDAPTDGQVLAYNAATSKWKNAAATGGGTFENYVDDGYEVGGVTI